MTAREELPNSELEERVRAVRRFNRFYTRKIGVLNPDSPDDTVFCGAMVLIIV
jgi:hypothetical protein